MAELSTSVCSNIHVAVYDQIRSDISPNRYLIKMEIKKLKSDSPPTEQQTTKTLAAISGDEVIEKAVVEELSRSDIYDDEKKDLYLPFESREDSSDNKEGLSGDPLGRDLAPMSMDNPPETPSNFIQREIRHNHIREVLNSIENSSFFLIWQEVK